MCITIRIYKVFSFSHSLFVLKRIVYCLKFDAVLFCNEGTHKHTGTATLTLTHNSGICVQNYELVEHGRAEEVYYSSKACTVQLCNTLIHYYIVNKVQCAYAHHLYIVQSIELVNSAHTQTVVLNAQNKYSQLC